MRVELRSVLFVVLLFSVITAGCENSISEDERHTIATVYAEMLIAKNVASGDSAAIRQSVDSTLNQHGFASEQELMEHFDELTSNPDYLREVLDSTQRYLERVERRTEGGKMNTINKGGEVDSTSKTGSER